MSDLNVWKRRDATLCNFDGTTRRERVWRVRVRVAGFAMPIAMALVKDNQAEKRCRWGCFDWHSGAFVTAASTRSAALFQAVSIIAKRGPERYAEAVQCVLDAVGKGKNLN
jgi:hypothetical protein